MHAPDTLAGASPRWIWQARTAIWERGEEADQVAAHWADLAKYLCALLVA
ncbi:hypothetical protein [Streptomyces sp. NPDC051704]